MDFGLGLVLSFTDNATQGINSAVSSLGQLTSVAESASSSLNSMSNTTSLSALSVMANQVGTSFANAGSAILSTFSQIINKVNETGTTVMFAKNQLNKLYEDGSGKDWGELKIAQISEYARKSIFDFENLIPVVTMLKANGIEAFDEIASSTGKSKQMLMDYAADLAAFNPQMRNMYGTGIQAAMGALNEYIAEGNAKSLKSGASLDITGILGEEKGKTIADRSRQVADLLEKLNMVGMTAQLADTPMTKLSNLGDTVFQFITKISESGVYDKFNQLISKVADYVNTIEDSEFSNLAEIVGSALSSIMTPIEKTLDLVFKLADAFRKLVKNNPGLAKLSIIAVAISGALLVVAGISLKAISSLSGLCIVFQTFGGSFTKMKTVLVGGLKQIIMTLGPLAVALTLLYVAWRSDFANIRTMATSFVSNLSNSFDTARSSVNGSISDLTKTLEQLKSKDDFFSNLTIGMMKVMMVGKALADAWNDYTLSEENYQKAKELGVLPLIEAILDLKYRFDNFKKGFIAGWKAIGKSVQSFIEGIANKADGTIFQSMIDGLTTFLEKLSNNDAEAWYKFGESFAKFTAKALLFFAVFKVADSVIGKLVKVAIAIGGIGKAFSGLASIGKFFGGFLPNIAGGLAKIFPALTKVIERGIQMMFGSNVPGILSNLKIVFTYVLDSILGFLGGLSAPILAIIVAIVAGIVAYIMTDFEDFKMRMNSIWTTIKDEALAIWESLKEGFIRIVDNIKNAVEPVVTSFMTLKNKIVEFFTSIGNSSIGQALIGLLSAIGQTVFDILVPAFNGILHIASTVFQGLWNIVVTVFNAIVSVVSTLLSAVMDIISGILDIIVGIFTLDFDKVLNGVSTVFNAIYNVVMSILTSVWNIIMSILTTVVNFFSSIGTTLVNIVMGALRGILTIVMTVFNTIFSTVQTVLNFILNIVSRILGNISDKAKEKFDKFKNTVFNAFEDAKKIVKMGIEAIKKFFNFELKLPKFKLPHFKIKGKLSLDPPSVPKFNVDWYKQGGIFNEPSVIGVGEAGKEAVMPLENNTGWIDNLASQIKSKMNVSNTNNTSVIGDYSPIISILGSCVTLLSSIANTVGTQPEPTKVTPISTQGVTTNNSSANSYITNTSNNSNVSKGDTDNSVTFEKGSIVIQCNNANEQEAEAMAKKIMQYIKRQKEIDDIMNYA